MSVAEVPQKNLTLDDVDDPVRYEIVDGILVEMEPMSVKSRALLGRFALALGNYGAASGLGQGLPEMLIKLPVRRDRNRRPDVVFVSYQEWPKDREFTDENAWPVRPDLCVEVVSPTDRTEPLMEKVQEYLEAGVKAVWVVYPGRAMVYVYESMDSVKVYRRDSVLPGGDVLPGFSLSLAEVMPQAVDLADSPDDE